MAQGKGVNDQMESQETVETEGFCSASRACGATEECKAMPTLNAAASDQAEPRAYRAVFFDLDGTLLPMDLGEFLSAYYRALAVFAGSHGHAPEPFMAALNGGIKAMMKDREGGSSNADVFWKTFFELYDAPEEEMYSLLEEFYATDFMSIGEGTEPDQNMVDAVTTLAAKGYPLVLATMPLFPLVAVRGRLSWAGVNPDLFSRLTTYENSTSSKPKIDYYAENLAACGLCGSDVLMVGNNTVEDLAIQGLGADAYLVTNHLLDPAGLDLSTVKHGTSDEFLAWATSLPACEHPALTIDPDIIERALTADVVDRDAVAGALEAQERMKRAAQAENERIARKNHAADGGGFAAVFEDDGTEGR